MNPLDWIRTIYGWLGVDYPRASLCGVVLLGALLGGAFWRFAAHVYKSHESASQSGATVNTTSGSQSPIIPDNHGNVSIKDEHTKGDKSK